MRALTWLSVVALAGCDYVWRVDSFDQPKDGRTTDTHPDDAHDYRDAMVDAPPGCVLVTMTVPATADAYIEDINPTRNTGGDELVEVHHSITSTTRGLWKFMLPAVPVTSLFELRLTLPYPNDGAPECGGCGATCVTENGPLGLFGTTSDWDEGQVTWMVRSMATTWQVPGADSPGIDRTASYVAQAQYSLGLTLTFDVSGPGLVMLESFVDVEHRLSFLLVPLSNVSATPTAREYACNTATDRLPSLEVKYCQ